MMPLARSLRASRGTLLAAGVLAVTSCSGLLGTEVAVKKPTALVIVQGDAQSGQAGRDLATQVVLRALDSAGVGVPGVTVTLAVVAGGGSVTPASDTTNSRGEFRTKWTLGPSAVIQTITASIPGVNPVVVGATGLLPTQIVLVQGNNQTAKTASALANPIIVRVVGNGNVPMQGITVGFQVLTGGGGMSPLTVVTNALGEATTKWTVGAAGTNTALVVSGSLTPVTLSATATP